MTYRTDDEKALLIEFLLWLANDIDLRSGIVQSGGPNRIAEKFLKERQVEREWGKKEC